MMQPTVTSLWKEYGTKKSLAVRQELVKTYTGLVHYVVRKYYGTLTNKTIVDQSDLFQIGVQGLIDAVERYDATKGAKFETYAVTRIRGTIQDELRRMDGTPRSVRKQARLAAYATTEAETAVATAIAETIALMDRDGDADFIESLPADSSTNPFDILSERELKNILVEAIEALPERERLIIALYYYENFNFKQIAGVLRLSESRVAQIHRSVLKKLREQLNGLV